MLFYRAALPLSRKTLDFVSGSIRRHRTSIWSRRRRLNPGQQALLVLAHLRRVSGLPRGRARGRDVTPANRWPEKVI
jgi:hypothetical protein